MQHVLQTKGIRLFSPVEFQRVLDVSLRAAQEFIKDHGNDLFLKLRNGLYALRVGQPQEEVIANRLYAPSYISLEYALSRCGIIPEAVYTVTSVTTRITREFIVNNRAFTYSHIKRPAYRGYMTERIGGVIVLIAEPEKALADYLYFVALKRKTLNERLDVRKLKKKIIIEYARFFGRESLIKLVKAVI
ncbi:MAG: hypothetical protein HYV36_05370 [Lentisphaerae bacterium]|nr:hypothetical protein [Lentisphaerota bacterium]